MRQLSYLVFVDDLIIFSKRHERSVQKIKKPLDYFSRVIGLVANTENSSIFLVGVTYIVKTRLLASEFPIRYLGFPSSLKKFFKPKVINYVKGLLKISDLFSIYNFGGGLSFYYLKVWLENAENIFGSV